MNDQVVGAHSDPPAPAHTNGHASPDASHLALPSNVVIQITQQRTKKEVISIEDSEEDAVRMSKPLRPKQRKAHPDPRKVRKLANRCLLCKQPGKKSAMRACLDCRNFAHLSCLELQGESGVRYRCRKCRHKREQGQVVAKKGVNGGVEQKAAGKRLQKEKRREEQVKKMHEFQLRYPYYFQEDKIRYPIEDKLLFIYRELFEFAETPKPHPQSHPLIPTSLLASFLQIQNFFSTFKEELVAYGRVTGDLGKDTLFLSLVRSVNMQQGKGLDVVFCSLMECLLKIYLSDIFDKNKTDNVRILNDHPFFTLLTHLHDNNQLSQEVIVRAAQEVLRYLATVPSMRRAFQPPPTNFPPSSLQDKTQLLLHLIRGLSEVDEFHSLVSIKSQRMQQLTKEKTQLVAQLKVDEAENLSNNEKLKDMTQAGLEMEQVQEGVTRQITKELDKHKKKMQRLASQQTKTEETIRDIRAKIAEIGRTMPFLTSEIQFLGLDRNDSEYFFYVREPDRLYVKFRSYLLDDSEDFYLYAGKEVITEVLRSLNNKGLREKHLYENITSLIKEDIFNFEAQPPQTDPILQEKRLFPITLEDVVRLVKDTEATFSVYLSLRQFQWAAPAVRELFMGQLSATTDLQILKEQLRSLQESFLFAEYSSPEGALRAQFDDQDGEIGVPGRKKVPIRIWGINSEKTKKYWLEYLEECIDVNGIWLCAYIFKNSVDKYVKKKMDAYYGEQQKDSNRPKPRARGRPPLSRQERLERMQRTEREKKSSSVNQPSAPSVESEEQSGQEFQQQDVEQQEQRGRRPNLRKRNVKRMNIVQTGMTQDSDEEMEMEEGEEDSSNEEMCEICGEYGEMLCCDTCPKVYHKDCLKMKDVPEGQWSCFKCLEKLSNERQTRSRVKRMGKFM